jgi:hypothetical protein
MIEWTAVATLILAAVTLVLGWQAKRQVDLSSEIERHRQSETHILEADPLSVDLVDYHTLDADGHKLLRVRLTAVGDKPVAGITATIRSDEIKSSASVGFGFVPPHENPVLTLPFEPFDLTDHCQVVVESHGLLGQRVIQTYRIRTDRIRGPNTGVPWYLERQEIIPNVEKSKSSVVEYIED